MARVRPLTRLIAGNAAVSTIASHTGSGVLGAQAAQATGSGAAMAATQLADWTSRSSAAAVRSFKRFAADADVTDYRHGAGTENANAHVYRDTTDGILGDGCLRIDVNPSVGTSQFLAWRFPLDSTWSSVTQGIGSDHCYIQFRCKVNQAWLTASTGGGGCKLVNIAGYNPASPNSSASFTNHEIVINNEGWGGYPRCYTRANDGSVNHLYIPFGGSDFRMQSALDNGSGVTPDAARYCLFSDSQGCFFFTADEWLTILMHIRIGTYGGTSGNEFDLWAARAGDTAYTKLFENRDFEIDSDPTYTGGLNGIWFLPFDTGRTAHSTTVSVKYDQLISSSEMIPVPLALEDSAGPAYFLSQTAKTWSNPLSGNTTITSVKPSPDIDGGTFPKPATINPWSGGTVAGKKLRNWGGGHGDYAGNEVYQVDFEVSAPQWARVFGPTPAAQILSADVYADGNPSSVHSAGNMVSVGNDSYMTGMRGYWQLGNSNGKIWKFAGATNTWSHIGTISGINISDALNGAAAYHSGNGLIYVTNQAGQVASINPSSGAVAVVTNNEFSGLSFEHHVAIWPSINALIVYRSASNLLGVLNLGVASPTWQACTTTTQPTLAAGAGIIWHEGSNGLLVWGHTSNTQRIYKLSPPVTRPASISDIVGQWRWSTHLLGGVTPTSAEPRGTWGRFGLIPALSARHDGIALVNAVDSATSMAKIPRGGI